MRLATIPLLLAAAALAAAQDIGSLLEKAPPDIDEALRARITRFYQLHVENKFRAAEQLVAEDSKDIFYGMDKPRCKSFAIGTIRYSDNFTRAKVMVACDTEMIMPAGRVPVKMPLMSLWKVEEGQWCWYAEPPGDREVMTPFGIHKPAPAGAGTAAPDNIQSKFVELSAVTRLVKADRSEIRFSPSAAGEEKVVITNGMPGGVTLALDAAQAPGLTFSLDRTSLEQGQAATLTVRYSPVEGRRPSASVVKVLVAPISQEITINISFSGAVQDAPARSRH